MFSPHQKLTDLWQKRVWFKVSFLLSTLWCLLHPIFWALDSCPEHFITSEDWSFKERWVMGDVSPWARQVCSFWTTDEIWIMKQCWHSVFFMKMLADFYFAPFVQKQPEKDKCDMCTFFFSDMAGWPYLWFNCYIYNPLLPFLSIL